MNFNLDDPLADLLSDNSLSNDNFFEQTNPQHDPNTAAHAQPGKQHTAQLKSRGREARLEDLFGIKEDPELEEQQVQNGKRSNTNVSTTAKQSVLITSTPRIRTQKPSTETFDFNADLDDDDDLGFDPKAPKASTTTNHNFDDWLTNIDNVKRPSTASGIGVGRRKDEKPIMSRQSTDTTTENSNLPLPQTRPKTSTGRRSSAQSTMLSNDPINIFLSGANTQKAASTAGAADNYTSASGMSTPQARKRANTADWLGLTPNENRDSTQPQQQQSQQHQHDLDIQQPQEAQSQVGSTTYRIKTPQVEVMQLADAHEQPQANYGEEDDYKVATNMATAQDPSKDTTAQNILLLGSMQIGTKHALHTLQQQEQQLHLAKQMQTQEVALLEMQRKQENVLQQQERQFQNLLQQQMLRQQQMEENIKMQQQRINAHIQLLMTQPHMLNDWSNVGIDPEDSAKTMRLSKSESEGQHQQPTELTNNAAASEANLQEVAAMENDIRRLELEKTRLEELVESMKVNYEKEMDIMAASYKKQIEFLESHSTNMEERLKAENAELKTHYTQKLQEMELEHNKYKSETEALIETLRADHEDELRKLRKTHEQYLDMLKDEHQRMIERIRETKILEFAAVQEGSNYMDTLRAASNNLATLSDGFHGLRDEMQCKIDALHAERTQKLDARERRIEDAERRLKLTEQTAEEEKTRLLDLVSTLEMQLNKISKESADENWQLRTKMASLEAEKAAFEREKEFTREQQLRDEKRLEDLKAMQLVEQQRKLADIQEERLRMTVERTKIEAERKLLASTDFDQQRLEIEAQFNVAHNAIKQADAERERYHKMQRQLEQQKRALTETKNMLAAKEDELENELCSYRVAETKAQAAVQKARQSEQQYQLKHQLLLKRMRELSDREAQLSQERLLLTQDRIAAHNMRQRLSQRKCVLCKMASENDEEDEMPNQFQQQLQQQQQQQRQQQDIHHQQQQQHHQQHQREQSHNYHGQGNVGSQGAGMAASVTIGASDAIQTDFVERLLDDNIQESFRRMKASNTGNVAMDFWNESGLDDDSKKLAMHTLENDLETSMFE